MLSFLPFLILPFPAFILLYLLHLSLPLSASHILYFSLTHLYPVFMYSLSLLFFISFLFFFASSLFLFSFLHVSRITISFLSLCPLNSFFPVFLVNFSLTLICYFLLQVPRISTFSPYSLSPLPSPPCYVIQFHSYTHPYFLFPSLAVHLHNFNLLSHLFPFLASSPFLPSSLLPSRSGKRNILNIQLSPGNPG